MEDAEWEFASSPIIHDGVVLVLCDVLENSFIAAFEASTGKELWRTERDEYPGWHTPNIYYDGVKCRVVVNGYKHRGGYDFATGAELWAHRAGTGNSYTASPVASDGKIYVVDDQGRVNVLKAGPEYVLLAENPLGEESMVAPALTDGIIFFRTQNWLMAVSEK